MDGIQACISPRDLYVRLGTAAAPTIIDIRSEREVAASRQLIVGALRRPPEGVAHWAAQLPKARGVVVSCTYDREAGRNVAAALRSRGIDATHLAGGMEAWVRQKTGDPHRHRAKLGQVGDPGTSEDRLHCLSAATGRDGNSLWRT